MTDGSDPAKAKSTAPGRLDPADQKDYAPRSARDYLPMLLPVLLPMVFPTRRKRWQEVLQVVAHLVDGGVQHGRVASGVERPGSGAPSTA